MQQGGLSTQEEGLTVGRAALTSAMTLSLCCMEGRTKRPQQAWKPMHAQVAVLEAHHLLESKTRSAFLICPSELSAMQCTQ